MSLRRGKMRLSDLPILKWHQIELQVSHSYLHHS